MTNEKFLKEFGSVKIDKVNLVRLPEIILTDEEKGVVTGEFKSNDLFLKKLINEGWKKFSPKLSQDQHQIYLDRLKEEFEIVKDLGFIDYFLLVWRVINKARQLGAFIDWGRGSAAGSLIFFLIGVTGVDPIDKKLFFARFISRVRAKKEVIDGVTYIQGDLAPDVDINLGGVREEIIQWLKECYPNKMGKITALSTFSGKILVKDVYKIINEASEEMAVDLASTIGKTFGVVEDIGDSYKNSEKFKLWADTYPKSYAVALKLRGLIRGKSTHASGYFISCFPLSEFVPIEQNKDGEITISYEMNTAAKFGIKLDLLGLTSNEIIKDIFENIPEKLEDIDLDSNIEVYRHLQDGNLKPYGLYQISADCAYRVCQSVKPANIQELSDVNAIARPGALAYEDKYVCMSGEPPHEKLREVFAESRNLPLYQEQLIQSLVTVGFSPEEGETVRKIVGKKLRDKMPEWKVKVFDKCKENGFGEDVAEAIWKVCTDSADYSFNRCLSINSIIATPKGPIYLKDVKVGDKILAYDIKEKQDIFVNVVKIYHNVVKLYKVELDNGQTLECSLDHKILCSDGVQRRLETIIGTGHRVRVIFDGTPEDTRLITSITELDKQNTIDLEVDHPDHNFYANGIVVSNSHSMATAYLGALTVYLKYKYPLQFFTACLNASLKLADSMEEIRLIQQELPYFNIELLPPHLLKSDMKFKVEGNNIRYGLSAIKGISDSAMEKLINFRGEYDSKIDCFIAAKQAGLNIGVLSALIQAGSLDELHTKRTRLVLEAQTYNLLTDREKRLVKDIHDDTDNKDVLSIIKTLNEKGQIKDSRFGTIKGKYDTYKEIYLLNSRNEEITNYFYERNCLGFSYSQNLTNIFKKKNPQFNTIRTILDTRVENDNVLIVGQIMETKVSKSLKGNKFYKAVISDDTGTITSLLFDGNRGMLEELKNDNAGDYPEKEDIVAVKGRLRGKDAIFADKIIKQDCKIYRNMRDLK